MSEAKEEKKKKGSAAAIIMISCGAVAGFFIGIMSISTIPDDVAFPEFFLNLMLRMLMLFAAFYLQIIIHEGGHLLAGLMTGYGFSSFRIGSLMLLKNEDGYSLKRFSLAGTGGQCLLIPPEKNADGSYPYRLYHSGGVLLNLITAVLFFGLYLLFKGENAAAFFLYLAIFGTFNAVTNGIPVHMGGVATDGYNVIHIGEDPFALDSMWIQLKINEAQTNGIRLKELPAEWFRVPETASKSNYLVTAIMVLSENRAMDELDFSKANEIIARLEGEEYSVIGLYSSLLLFDKVTMDLLEKGKDADVSELDSKQNKAFRKSMARFPSVIRTEYAIRLLKDEDRNAAGKYRELFDSVAGKYPMKSDIASETEILAYLDSCADHEKGESDTGDAAQSVFQ